MPIVTTQNDKVFFKECAIAGWNFHDLEDNWDELSEGQKLVLVRERNNKYDANAIAVAFPDDYDENEDFDFKLAIGYVPRTENELMARMMDMGWSDAFTAEISTVKRYGAYADRLRMSIYIQHKKETQDAKAEQIFAIRLDDETYRRFVQEILANGFTYFRWGGFPVWNKELPKRGNKVVFIHNKTDEQAELYLMHVIADDEEKAKFFIPNPNELNQVDDCAPFILTNIKGPVLVKLSDLSFLYGESVDDYQSERPLTEAAASKILEILI